MKFVLGTFLILFIVFVKVSPGNASDFFHLTTFSQKWHSSKKNSFLEGRISKTVLDSIEKEYNYPLSYTFYGNSQRLIGQAHCALDLYNIDGNEIYNHYKGFNFGYNCTAYGFERDSISYMLGGYGFWNNHMDLIQFDYDKGGWELVVTKNQPLNISTSVFFQTSKGIFSPFVTSNNPRIPNPRLNEPGYFLDWENKTWKKINFFIEGVDFEEILSKVQFHSIETEDYLFFGSEFNAKNIGWNLIQKESGKIYFISNQRGLDPFFSLHLEVLGNKINYMTSIQDELTLDLDDFFAKSKEVGKITILDDEKSLSTSFGLIFFPVALFCFAFLAILYVKRKRKLVDSTQLITDMEPIDQKDLFQMVLSYSGQKIGTEELDEIFGIQGMKNFDTKRIKRARHIKEINSIYMKSHGKELIVRDRNPDDKRYMFYKILP